MITVHRASSAQGGWVEAIAPDDAERERLTEELGLPPHAIDHSLDDAELPRVQQIGGAILVVVRVPAFRGPAADVPHETIPLGIVLVEDLIATVCAEPNEVADRLKRFAEREWVAGAHHRFVLHALAATAEAFVAHLRRIDERVDELEGRLRRSLGNREVLGLLQEQKSLVLFSAALGGLLHVMEAVEKTPELEILPGDRHLLEETRVEVRQAIEMTMLSTNMLSSMMDAFASIISNNLNVVMKFLATMTVVLTFPVIVAGFWGMNVALPGAETPAMFSLLVAGSFLISAVVAAVFRKLRWL